MAGRIKAGTAPQKARRSHTTLLPDRLFKEFLRRFLADFLKVFFPTEAARLNFATLSFLDKELVINLPDQELRITDVVAEVQTWEGEPETIIVHVEVEGRNKRTLPQRMSEYYALLRVLRRKPVLPIAFVLLWKAGGLAWKEYKEELFGQKLLRFRYGVVGVRDLISEKYLAQNNPVAAALTVLMEPEHETRAAIKLSALQTVPHSNLGEGDKLFLMELMNTYAPTAGLSEPREEIMQNLATVEMTWGERLRAEGRAEGEAQGELNGKRKMLLHLLTLMFGPLPEAFVERVTAIADDAGLDALSRQMLRVKKLDEITFPPKPITPPQPSAL